MFDFYEDALPDGWEVPEDIDRTPDGYWLLDVESREASWRRPPLGEPDGSSDLLVMISTLPAELGRGLRSRLYEILTYWEPYEQWSLRTTARPSVAMRGIHAAMRSES